MTSRKFATSVLFQFVIALGLSGSALAQEQFDIHQGDRFVVKKDFVLSQEMGSKNYEILLNDGSGIFRRFCVLEQTSSPLSAVTLRHGDHYRLKDRPGAYDSETQSINLRFSLGNTFSDEVYSVRCSYGTHARNVVRDTMTSLKKFFAVEHVPSKAVSEHVTKEGQQASEFEVQAGMKGDVVSSPGH